MAENDFYVGHSDRAPPTHARRQRAVSITLVVVCAALAGALAAQQSPLVPAVYEIGEEREFTGWVRERPAPRLVVAVPGAQDQAFALASYLLVSTGKRGADAAVHGLDGRHARVRGTLAYLDGQTMIELAEDAAITPLAGGDAAPASHRQSLGRVTLRGEIVDSKCHFGVMNPATGKVHRACAANCLRGGVPPVLLARTSDSGRLHLLVTGDDGRAIGRELLDIVAEPLEVSGRVERIDGLLVLRAEPERFVRVP
jgi:hypothetical protein